MIRSILACMAILLLVTGCANQNTKVVAVASKRPEAPPMPLECRADGMRPFETVRKRKGNKTRLQDLAHALQGNKSRMARNKQRARVCECSFAQRSSNKADKARLAKDCKFDPPSAPASRDKPSGLFT